MVMFSGTTGLAARVTATVSGLLLATTATATVMTWDLAFYDGSSTQIGAGSFSYDLSSETFFEEFPGATTFGLYVDTALTEFSATISGNSWQLFEPPMWWQDDAMDPGWQKATRYDIEFVFNQWLFGWDPLEPGDTLDMTGFNRVSDTFWEGSWEASLFDQTIFDASPFQLQSGSWTASLATPDSGNMNIPIPPALLLFATALAGLGLAGIRRKAG